MPLSVWATPKYRRPARTTPSVCDRRWTRLRATALGWNPVAAMTASTDLRVSGDTSGRPLITRDTVCVETPHMRAISLMVILCWKDTSGPRWFDGLCWAVQDGIVNDNGNDNGDWSDVQGLTEGFRRQTLVERLVPPSRKRNVTCPSGPGQDLLPWPGSSGLP